MKVLFKFLYLHVWKGVTFYIGILYNEIAQIKSVLEIMAGVVAFCAWRHINLTNRQIAVMTLGVGMLSVVAGWLLEKSGGPQKSNAQNNSINPELSEIADWVREQKAKGL